MNLKKLYYHITAYIPRKLPATEADFLKFKDILLKHFELPDEPQTYAVIAGQIQSTPGHALRKSFGVIANNVKRLKINALAQCYRVAANEEMKHKLETLVAKEVADIQALERAKVTEQLTTKPE